MMIGLKTRLAQGCRLGGLCLIDFSVGDPEIVLDRQVAAGKCSCVEGSVCLCPVCIFGRQDSKLCKEIPVQNLKELLVHQECNFQEFVKHHSTIS